MPSSENDNAKRTRKGKGGRGGAARQRESKSRSRSRSKSKTGERLDAETALARSEARYRTLVENAPDLILTVDAQGTLLFINRVFPPYEMERVIGASMFQFIDPATHDVVRERLAAVFATGETQSYETKSWGADGQPAWYSSRIGAIKHGDEVIAATIIATDVTQIRHAAEALRERQRFIQQITDTAPFLLYVYDVAEQRNVYVNSQIVDLLGYAPEQIEAMGPQIAEVLVHPDDRRRTEEALHREMAAADGEVVEVEYRMRHARGEWRWFHTRNVVFERDPAGAPRQILGTAHDTTARREAEEALRQSEAKLRSQSAILESTFDSISDGVVVADEAGRFVVFNRAARDILGIGPVDESSDRWSAAYGLFLPDMTTPYPTEQLPLVRAGRGEHVDDAEIFVRHAGRPEGVWLSVSARPMFDAAGACRGSVAAFRDVTESKRAQELILAEQQVKEQMLIAHDRDRQLMAYEIHDGLVQTVTAAKMHLEALAAQFAKSDVLQGAGFDLVLKLLRDAIDDGRRLISGLRPPSIDELGVIAALDDLVREQAAQGGPRIDFVHDVRFDRLQPIWETVLYRIVQEALFNARLHSRARRVAVRISQVDDVVHVVVADDGVGFEPRNVPKSRFGLRGIRERARLLDGRAEIVSAPGQGTTVRVELPIATAQTIAEQAE